MESPVFLKPFLEILATVLMVVRLWSFCMRQNNGPILAALYAGGIALLWHERILPHSLDPGLFPIEVVLLTAVVLAPGLSKIFYLCVKQTSRKNVLKNGTLEELLKACEILSESRTGALLAIERQDDLSSFIRKGVTIDAKLRHELLLTIFTPPTYLHDGGVILRGGRIASCSAIFPLSNNPKIKKDLGTRHRAALGMSEETDALCLVISEESGAVSITDQGRLFYDVDPAKLRGTVLRLLNFKKIKQTDYLENHHDSKN